MNCWIIVINFPPLMSFPQPAPRLCMIFTKRSTQGNTLSPYLAEAQQSAHATEYNKIFYKLNC